MKDIYYLLYLGQYIMINSKEIYTVTGSKWRKLSRPVTDLDIVRKASTRPEYCLSEDFKKSKEAAITIIQEQVTRYTKAKQQSRDAREEVDEKN